MAEEIRGYTTKAIEVTPFGVDLDIFRPRQVASIFDKNDIVIGTIKALEEEYGIEYLIRAFRILKKKQKNLPLKLLIVGGGFQEKYLKDLARELKIDRDIVFAGRVSHNEVPNYHNMLSVFVSLSNNQYSSPGLKK